MLRAFTFRKKYTVTGYVILISLIYLPPKKKKKNFKLFVFFMIARCKIVVESDFDITSQLTECESSSN